MAEAEPILNGSSGRPTRKPLLTQRSGLICVCLAIGIALIAGAPSLLQGPGNLRCSQAVNVPAMPAPPPIPAVSKRLELPWVPVLTKEEVRRGQTYYGSGVRLNRLANKLLAGKPINVYALGGSVTGGGGASRPNGGYVKLFFSFIKQAFPHEEHVLVNKAIAASTAFLYATCLRHHVPEDADLVTLEFAVNERSEAAFTSPERRAFEQLLRRLLQYPRRPAIIILHHFAWWESPGDGLDRGVFYHQPEGQLTEMAHYYDIPTLSVRAAAYHLMAANLVGFKVDKVPMIGRLHNYFDSKGNVTMGTIPVSPAAEGWDPYFTVDGMHPGNLGHQALAELLVQPLIRAVYEAETGEAVQAKERRRDPKLPDMPRPMIPDNADSTPGFCAMMEDFKPVVKNTSGFEYLPERPKAADFMHQKWGWRAEKPGAWAELEVDTRPEKGAGADTIVWLAHLRSYKGMGAASIECVSGCTCTPGLLDGTWKRRASLFWMARLLVSRHQRCRLRVTVLKDPGEFPQEGHKVTLVAVMVAHLDLAKSGTLANVQELQNMRLLKKRRRYKKKKKKKK